MKVPNNPPQPNTPSAAVATQQWVSTYYSNNNPKVIAGALSAGPPGGLGNGGIWIATVDTSGTVWVFRYNANSSSIYKWEFIGGVPLLNRGDPNAVINTKTQIGVTGNYYDPTTMSVSLLRAGDYVIQGSIEFDTNAGANGWGALFGFVGSTIGSSQVGISATAQAGTFSVSGGDVFRGMPATSVAGISVQASLPGTYKMRNAFVSITPIRIS